MSALPEPAGPGDASAARAQARGDWVPRLAGWLAVAVGAANVASTLTPNLTARTRLLDRLEPAGLVPLAHAAALPAGVALIVLGANLSARRHRAWRLALLVALALVAINLVKGLDAEEALAALGLAGLLFWARDAFYVRHESGGLRETARRAAIMFAAVYAGSLVAVWGASGAVEPRLSLGRSLQEAGALLALVPGPERFTGAFRWLPIGVGSLSVMTLLIAAYALFSPLAASRRTPDAPARRLAGELVRAHGADTLAFFKLRPDQQYFFSRDGRAFAGYRIEGRVVVVSGDPIGPPDAIAGLLRELGAFAEVRGLRLAVVGCTAALADQAPAARLRAFYLGDEAIVELDGFTLSGRPIRKVRQAVARAKRAGFRVELIPQARLHAGAAAQLEAVSERFRAGEPERGYSMSMGSLQGDHQADGLVIAARDASGAPRAFLHLVPSYGRPAMSLSMMRRDPDTPNGLTEFLVVEAIELLRARGIRELSLNFAVLARLMQRPDTRGERLLGIAARMANPFFQLESLYRFNAKFSPRWEPRYLLYEGAFGLPRAGLAVMRCEGLMPRLR